MCQYATAWTLNTIKVLPSITSLQYGYIKFIAQLLQNTRAYAELQYEYTPRCGATSNLSLLLVSGQIKQLEEKLQKGE